MDIVNLILPEACDNKTCQKGAKKNEPNCSINWPQSPKLIVRLGVVGTFERVRLVNVWETQDYDKEYGERNDNSGE